QGNSNMFANMASQSIEVIETEQPMQILSYEFVPDRAGPGKYRGGAPFRKDYRFLEREAVLQVRSDRRHFRPYGLYGGYPGKPSANSLNPADENRPLESKITMNIGYGTVFRHDLAGGGGWGDPLEREPDKVLVDVRNELVSPEAAFADYGVVVDTATWSVDTAATESQRSTLRAGRPDEQPKVMRQEPAAVEGT
ncbi:MAG: hydantoinase B/oxoprolinase family protein, partial [Rhodospirillaceae bacterium]|nr:hydantoinase B/oxoprolinase family protein [Rhodospirillaceae bacterium]